MTFSVTNLRCNYLVNPIGIDDPAPRFSWQIVSDERAVLQSAYEIQVRDAGGNLLWGSRKVGSLRSIHVPYAGLPLASAGRYFWRVRSYDNHGSPSYWSPDAWFEMGLLSMEDWQASWIEPSESVDVKAFKPCPLLRREFNVEAGLVAARLYITSHGLYEAHLNGEIVGDQVFTPGYTPYDLRLQYQVYDVTLQLTEGANVLGVILGDGWYRGKTGISDLRNVYGTRLGLLAQLALWYDDGHTGLIASDGTWRSSTGPIITADLKDGEVYDARLELPGWDLPDYDESDWQPVNTREYPLDNLSATLGVPVRMKEEFAPLAVLHTPNGETVLDFGQNIAGMVRFRIEASSGTTVILTHGETLDAQGNFTMANLLLPAARTTLKQQVRYTCRGGEPEEHAPRFTVHGFRYVKLEGWPSEPNPADFRAFAIYSDMPVTGNFECSSPQVNQLMHNVLWSMKGNFLDIPTDCPTRERAGWTGDAQIFARTGSFLMETGSFFTKWLRDLALEQYPSGMVSNWVPNPQRPMHAKGLFKALEGSSGWGDAAVIIPWTLYQVYGDVHLLATQYPSMRAWVEYMRSEAQKTPWFRWLDPGIWLNRARRARQPFIWATKYHWGEWLEPDATLGLTTGLGIFKRLWFGEPVVATAYFAYSSALLAEAARALGYDDDASTYYELSQQVAQAYNSEFIGKDGRISPDKQASYVRALALNLVPEEKRKALLGHLVRKIRAAGTHIGTGFLSTPFLLPELAKGGQLEMAYALLNQTTIPSWLYPITKGATTVWEKWDGITPEGKVDGSHNHYSYGAVASWLVQTVAGIEIGAPGYQQIRIQPQPGGGLTWARASYTSLYGEISSSWEIARGTFTLHVVIPPNTRATVRLPGACDSMAVHEGGAALSNTSGVTGWRPAEGATLIEVGSGAYTFRYPYNG